MEYREKETILQQKSALQRWKRDWTLIFFFCWLKLSMMTPMKRFRVKKEPKIMKMTK